jgi:hypothetical protein
MTDQAPTPTERVAQVRASARHRQIAAEQAERQPSLFDDASLDEDEG